MAADVITGGVAGEFRQAQGSAGSTRQGPYNEAIVNDGGYGRFFEACRNNRIFYLYAQNVTLATTHNTPLALASATPIVGIINTSANKAASILTGFFAWISGTPPTVAQAVWNGAISATSVSTAGVGTITGGLLGASASVMKPMNSVALTGLNVAASNLVTIRPFGGALNVGVVAANHDAGTTDPVDGSIIVPPGAMVGIFAGTSAGTTVLMNAGMSWCEVDWPL